MLIEAPYKIGDNVSFKLSSGEEIIARLEKEDDKSYTLTARQGSRELLSLLCLGVFIMIILVCKLFWLPSRARGSRVEEILK